MDLQSAEAVKVKHSLLSKVIVALCLMLTAGLLISSLVSPGRADNRSGRASAVSTAQL